MTYNSVLQTFEVNWCPQCMLPRKWYDPSLKEFCCRCNDEKGRYRVFVNRAIRHFTTAAPAIFGEPFGVEHATPLGFNTKYAPQENCFGLACLAIDSFLHRVAGYCFLYEVDFPLHESENFREEMHVLAQGIAARTGTCILLRTQGGYHFASINVIPKTVFRDLFLDCQEAAPSNFTGLDVRLNKKSNEHLLNRFQQFYTAKSPYVVSKRHRMIWELALNVKLQHQQTEESFICPLHVFYTSWH